MGITKLSDLKAGKVYRITADEVEATFQVLTAGETPLCVINGMVRNVLTEDDDPLLVQLIGWAVWGDSMFTKNGFRLFTTGEQPQLSWLIGVRNSSSKERLLSIACAPEIVEFDPANPEHSSH